MTVGYHNTMGFVMFTIKEILRSEFKQTSPLVLIFLKNMTVCYHDTMRGNTKIRV